MADHIKNIRLPDAAKYETHIWADYIELKCLSNIDGTISKSDIYDSLSEAGDLNPVFESEENGEFRAEDEDKEGEEEEGDDSPQADKETLLIETWFDHLKFRSIVFDRFYPFQISDEGDVLFKKEQFTDEHKFYFYLLVSSNTRILAKESNRFTDGFEDVSRKALIKYLNSGCEVSIFGRYPGNLWNKINQLAKNINESVVCREDQFSPMDMGDGGLDIVGWKRPGDDNKSFLLMFGQCACTLEEWEEKQHSSSAVTWRSYLTLKAPPSNVTFVPFFYRNSTGDWHADHKIHESILIDRQRLIHLLGTGYEELKDILPYDIVDELIATHENLV